MPRPITAQVPSSQVFVGGCARSGAALLGEMLGADPETQYLPEAPFIAELATDKRPLDMAGITRLTERIARHPSFAAWNAEIASERFLPLASQAGYDDIIDALAADHGQSAGKARVRRWIAASPANIQWAGRLAAAFPRAKFIHIYRDGRAVANSLLPLDWGPNDIIGMAAYWREMLSVGFGLSAMLPADRLLHVKYEDVVRHPGTTMHRVAAFLGPLPGTETPDGGGRTARATLRTSNAPAAGAAGQLNAWRDRLSAREIEVFEYLNGGMLSHLGYGLVAGRRPRAPSSPERWRWRVRDAVKRRMNARRDRTDIDGVGAMSAG